MMRTSPLAGVPVRAMATIHRAKASNAAVSSKIDTGKPVVLVDGCRTPFMKSGTTYMDLMAHDLAREAIKGLYRRNSFEPASIDHVVMGTVIQECRTSNVAREAVLGAGFPDTVPAHTVTMACISANAATSNAIGMIKSGQAEACIAGGVETMSDVPIRWSRPMRKRMLNATMFKKKAGMSNFAGTKLKDLAPEAPAVAEFTSNEVMGHSADRLCAMMGVGREEQDAFAARSHQGAAQAAEAGKLKDVITMTTPVFADKDNGVRGETTAESLSKLKPAFIKPHGTVTAGNASYLTDGASASLIMSAEAAKARGHMPLSYLRRHLFVSQDPKDQLLLGPAYGIAKLLSATGLTLNDFDVFELHEAFAGQVLANLNALDSQKFCSEQMNTDRVGRIPMDKLNNWGGSLSIGHPFGATGTRLLTTASHRLIAEDGKLALVAACAAGGQGVAAIVERA